VRRAARSARDRIVRPHPLGTTGGGHR
jgi:hypothetical protein